MCFAKSCHQSFCLLLKPAIYPVSDHSCPSSLVFPLCQFESRKDRVLPSRSDNEGLVTCFRAWSNWLSPLTIVPPSKVPCGPQLCVLFLNSKINCPLCCSQEASASSLAQANAAGHKVSSRAVFTGRDAGTVMIVVTSVFVLFLGWILGTSGYPQMHHVAKDYLKPLILLSPYPKNWITGSWHQASPYVLGIEPLASVLPVELRPQRLVQF